MPEDTFAELRAAGYLRRRRLLTRHDPAARTEVVAIARRTGLTMEAIARVGMRLLAADQREAG